MAGFFIRVVTACRAVGDKVSPVEDPQTGIHHILIELMAAHLDDLLHGTGNAEGGAIGAVRGHGFDDIGNGEDAGLQQDLIPLESQRIAGAIEILVVLVDHPGDGRGSRYP